MQVNSVALAAGYSAVLSLLNIDTNGPVAFSLSVGQTSSDSFNLYGTLDSAAVDNTNAFLIGTFSGGATNLPKNIADQAKRWPFLLIQRAGGSTAGSLFVAGNPAASPAVVSAAAPVVVGNYSALLTLTTLGAETVRIGTSRQMVVGDSFDVYASDDSALASLTGAFYAGRIYGGGGANVNNTVLVSGYNYAIIRRVTGSTAGNVIAAGVSPSAGGGNLNLTTLLVADTAVSGPIGALTNAQTDPYSSFLLTQTTASVVATIPNPAVTTPGKVALVTNNDTSTQPIIMYGENIGVGATQLFLWDGSAWVGGRNVTAGGNAFGGTLAIGTLDATSIRILQNAGVVFADDGTNTIVGATAGARAVAVQSGTGGIGLLPGTGALNLGADATDKTITAGSGTGVSAFNLNVGTGGAALASNATDHSTTVGSVTGVSQTTVQGGTNGVSLVGTGVGGVSMTPGAAGAIILLPRGAGAGDTATLQFRELAAGGTELIGLKAPDAIGISVNYTLPTGPSISGQQLESTTAGVWSWGGMVNVIATNANAQTIADGAAAAIVTTWTEVLDTATAFDNAAGTFTVPVGGDGLYEISASLQYAATAADLAVTFDVNIAVGGVIARTGRFVNPVAALAQTRNVTVTAMLQLVAGNVVTISAALSANGGVDVALTNSALFNFLSIARISA